MGNSLKRRELLWVRSSLNSVGEGVQDDTGSQSVRCEFVRTHLIPTGRDTCRLAFGDELLKFKWCHIAARTRSNDLFSKLCESNLYRIQSEPDLRSFPVSRRPKDFLKLPFS